MANHCGTLKPSAPIDKLDIDIRVVVTLDRNGKRVIQDLTESCACEILDLKDISWRDLGEIIDALHDAELSLNPQCRAQRTSA